MIVHKIKKISEKRCPLIRDNSYDQVRRRGLFEKKKGREIYYKLVYEMINFSILIVICFQLFYLIQFIY